ncbi:exodeoxyribonuclease VII large subunit [candidate division WOR-1 bacterium RIFOXYA12_FULL_52_29]|uniref:Exodeoxyribonuclease 7 large subunit n=1 Tax=candidate division WOR-1 bacterium RIFOXYC12_FULL_54_18 TaxID=1802584 RepID=A0A1F4T747_UNCSA|nr:MAG: exodeoxyribonuclease VII large subunit [candidate division WOR-1 bacterium RIFOXYA2_FULL_51_19]OGC18117.1 MAG: exodeoxyribonuclease VII large subunit [candidate division WOR-1 bacterium RIFOXYA12_FULL_52_29]OGC26972.1 MAG: exodeoxyribonuclease VII large subunit [candidate division WOR-1 bacterium RIFOXYB2_FULL_45_9]OGC28534.1 MAG: exodeoxyribonuclease VII large subunit [candidate division WOR-1 bacterium RIFOXYC12_FULL_54_18]OGC31011.1 MAG: exodeoxyribonuclease VII large subunit [candid
MNERILTIGQLNQVIKMYLKDLAPEGLWVKGEILGYKLGDGGRYATFIVCEKEEGSNKVVAQAQAMCWGTDLSTINGKLRTIDRGLGLKDGIIVQLKCVADLWPQAGRFQLIVKDIEPSVTLGELHLLRLRLYQELAALGVQDKNKQIPIPLCPLRVALITAKGCAGYNDFIHELWGSRYPFKVDLYNSAVQGEGVEKEVVGALKVVARRAADYDAVVIVRGGGAVTDLKWFDNKAIGLAIAGSPLPILTGIGHEINLSLADMVANANFKTPTAAAAFLVEKVREYELAVDELVEGINQSANLILRDSRERLRSLIREINSEARQCHVAQSLAIENLFQNISNAALEEIKRQEAALSHLAEKIAIFEPKNTLKLGYSITRGEDGRVLRRLDQVGVGEQILTQLVDGKIVSNVSLKERGNGN